MIKIKHLISFVAIAFLSMACAFSSVISFQIIQHDNSQDEVRESSYIVENTMFDFFFDKGFITTNCPTATTKGSSGDKKVFSKSLMEAKNGQCTYFILLTIDYNVNLSKNPKGSVLSNIDVISWQLYETKTSTKIASGSKKVGVVPSQKNNEKGIASFICEIASDIYGKL